MRKFFRSLSLILCFAMLFAAMPEAQLLVPMSVAAAEEEQPAAEQPAEVSEPDPTQEPTQVPEETEQPEETAVPEETAEAEVTLPPSEEVEVLPTEEVPDENEIDYTKDASFSPAFVSGYAKLKSDTSLYEGSGAKDEEIAVLGSGVVYAVVRDIGTECDRLQIVFNDGSEELARGWVDADRVTPMDPETDVPTFTRDAMTDDDVRIYNDKYPLLPVQCVYAAQEAIEAVAADDASAEANAVETSALKRPGVMTIKADRTTIGANTKAKLTITATAGHTMENYRLASDHENLLILDQPEKKGRNATATASKNVTKATTITIQLIALTDDALLDSIEIEVLPAPTASDIIVDREIRIGYKCTYQLNPTYKDGTMCDSFTYMIAEKDADYASVTQNGLVTAKSPIIGDTKKPVTIYIMPNNNTSARVECKLYILEAPERVTASRTKVTIGAGDSIDLVQACTLDYAPGIDQYCAGQLTFKSSSSSVAKVSSAGVVEALKKGTAKITVSLSNNTSAKKTITVQVLSAAKSATLKLTNNPIGSQMKGILSISFAKNTYSSYSVSAEPEGVLSFTKSGENLIGYTAQTVDVPTDVTVTVAADNGNWSESTVVRVLPGPEHISVKEKSMLISYGERGMKVEGVCDDSDTLCSFTYSSAKPSLLQVDATTGEMMVLKDTITTPEAVTVTVRSTNSDAVAYCEVSVVPQPKEIVLSSTSVNLGKGDTFDLMDGTVGVSPEGTHATFTFKSSKTSVATVDEDGVITAKKAGTAKITVKTHISSVPSVTFTVNVSDAMSASKKPTLSLSAPVSGKIGTGMSGQLTITFPKSCYSLYDLQADNDLISFDMSTFKSSYNSSKKVRTDTVSFTVGDVDDVTDTVISLISRANPDIEATLEIELLPAPTEIDVEEEELLVGKGQPGAKIVGICPDDAACDFVYTKISGSSITIDEKTGVIDAREIGRSVVRVAATNSEAYIDCTVVVTKAPEKISFTEKTLKIGVGDTLNLLDAELLNCYPEGTATGYKFSSGSTKYVTVTADGTIKGIRTGKATIKATSDTITSEDGKTASIKVTVCSKPKSVSFTQEEYTTGVGMSIKPSVKFNSTSAYSLCSYEVADESIATVDEDTGAITAQGEGSTEITVTTQSGVSDTAILTVLPTPDEISVKTDPLIIGIGQTNEKVTGVYPDGTACDFTYEVIDGDTISINETSGVITPIETGTSTVRVYSANSDAFVDCTVDVRPNPEKIAFTQKTIKIGIGDTINLLDMGLLTCVPEDAATAYTFKTGNKKYATVSADGTVKGLRKGTVTITATSSTATSLLNDDKTATIRVTVCAQPKGVAFTQGSYTLGIGMKVQTAVKFTPATSSYAVCSYEIEDESVATVDANGVITAASVGETTLTVRTKNAKNTAVIRVLDAPTYVSFIEDSYEVMGGKQLDLNTIIEYDEDTLADFSFTIVGNGSKYATIDEKGVLTANARGTVYVRVTARNGEDVITSDSTCAIICDNPPSGISYGFASVTIAKGDTVKIPEPYALDTAGNVVGATYTYKSSNTRYVKIVDGSYMQGVKTGSANITATSHNGKTTTIKVNVSAKGITSVSIDRSEIGDSATLYTNGDSYVDSLSMQVFIAASNLTYASLSATSSDPDVVEVTECRQIEDATSDGITYQVDVIARGAGTAEIVVKNGSKSDSFPITVYTLCEKLSFAEKTVDLSEGQTTQLVPVFEPDGSSAKLTYRSSKTSVATVDENGLVRGVAEGTARITATTPQGLTAYVDVTVLASPIGISLNVSGLNLEPDETVTIKPTLIFKSDSGKHSESISYSSSCPSVATVDENGTITALREGSATVTATTVNGLSVVCQVTVVPQGSEAKVDFAWSEANIVKGDTAVIPLVLNKDALENGYNITSSNTDALSVDGESIVAHKVAKGVVLTLSVNGNGETGEAEQYTCTVNVIANATVSFSHAIIDMSISSGTEPRSVWEELTLTIEPKNLVGTNYIEVVDVDGSNVAEYSLEDSRVYALSAGTADVICHTFNRDATCEVIVDDKVVYRALVISEYNQQAANALKFATNNVNDVTKALGMSEIDGETYSIKTLKNPTKGSIASAITEGFADADENDISVIYIVSHGYNKSSLGGYHFGISNGSGYSTSDSDSYVKGSELVGWLRQISGNVILVLDSCTSGAFITQNSSALSAAGNIAVITAQTTDKTGFYYVAKADVSKSNTSSKITTTTTEMMTYAFAYGLGFDQLSQSSVGLKADSNGDGVVTIAECFAYTESLGESKAKDTKKKVENRSWGGTYYGNLTDITYSIPSGMQSLVIAGRE